MNLVEDFIYNQEGKEKEILLYFHHLFIDSLGLSCKIRYKIPFYDQKSWICYLNPLKSGGVELVFLRGQELSNSQGLLQAKERKMVSGITISDLKDIPEEAIFEIMQEALLLDETIKMKK